jgi:flagellar hook-associated protein 2
MLGGDKMSDILRITGLVSGMDTDTTVKKLIQLEQTKVDKAEQEKQYLEWQREDYRDISNVLRGFQDEYFDVLNSATNMRSDNTFALFSASATLGGATTSSVSIQTTGSSITGEFTIDSVTRLATKDSYVSGSEVLSDITTGVMSAIGDINTQIDTDNTLTFTLDGVTKEVSLNQTDYLDFSEFAADLSTKLQEAFSNVDITAEVTGAGSDQLAFKVYQNGTTTDEPGHVLTIENDNSTLLGHMNVSSGTSNTVNMDKSLADVFGKSGSTALNINGTSFIFAETDTISSVLNEINSSSAGVTIGYDSFSDKFTLESNGVGTDSTITITDTNGLLADFKLQGGAETHTGPVNSEFVVNGVTTTRSSNTFEINGTYVTLNEVPSGSITVDVGTSTDTAKELIVKFVASYNEMIVKINDKLAEKRNYDYDPLTDEQKTEMTDDDIESWQKEARKGTLRNDNVLRTLTNDLRESLYETITGVGITLSDIGIQTSANYKDQGKLIIDETKLDTALRDRPNEVIQLFTKESEVTYTDYSNRSSRYNQNGLSNRIHDIIQDNIRLTRDDDGNKGYLIDKAGIETGTDSTSYMAERIQEMDDKIDDLLDLLANQEEKYYAQFAAMESAMSQLSNQSAWLASQFGGGA